MRALGLIILGLLAVVVLAAFLCQGPVVTVLIIVAWMQRFGDRRKLADETAPSITVESVEPPTVEAPPREGTYFFGLILTSVAVLLDWNSLITDFLERSPVGTDRSVVEMTEAITRSIPVVSGIALLLTAFGRGKGKVFTMIASSLLLVGSFGLIVLEGCSHNSW